MLHRREIHKLIVAIQREGMTVVPLRLYFNDRGIAKLEIALAKGKKLHDKRQSERKRERDSDRSGDDRAQDSGRDRIN